MEKYRITIFNNISGKKRRLNIEATSFERAIELAGYKVHYTSERIIKAEIWHNEK